MRVQTDAGTVIDLGTTGTTPTIGITDYSRRDTDAFGVTTITERGFARRMSLRFSLPFDSVDATQRSLAALRATPALWIADDSIAWLKVRGLYKDFSVDLATPPTSFCTLSVDGLTDSAAFSDPGGDPAPVGSVSTLQLIQPAAITSAALVSSSVVENDYAAWSAETSYALGARVISLITHRIYESLVASNIGSDPTTAPAKWLDVAPTNRWAMLDQATGTATSANGSITVTINTGPVNAVALLDVTGATVRVQRAGYDRTVVVGSGAVTFPDLPASGGQVTVTISGSGTVSVGTLLLGQIVQLGVTEASPTAGITDYSRKDTDAFGDVTIVERAWVKQMTAKALIRSDAVDMVASRIAAVRARPSLWIGQSGLDSLTIYGFFKDFSIEVGTSVSTLSLSIEGLSQAAQTTDPFADLGGDIDALNLAMTGVQEATAVARNLAASKGRAWFQPTPPSADASAEGDVWFDTSNGNYPYQRLAGSGRLSFGGNKLTFGGAGLILAPWAPVADARVASALSQASSALAQSTQALSQITVMLSDGVLDRGEKLAFQEKVSAIQGEYAPLVAKATAQGVSSTAYATAYNALFTYLATIPSWSDRTVDTAIPDPAAHLAAFATYYSARNALTIAESDLTAANQGSLSDVADIQVAADYAGAINPGQLPQSRSVRRYLGQTDVTPQTACSASVTPGATITLNNTAGDDQRGTVFLTGLTASSATITVTTLYAGVTLLKAWKVYRNDAAPPATGGGGSGGGGGTTPPGSPASASVFTAPGSNTTHQVMATLNPVSIGSAGTMTITFPAEFHSQSEGSVDASGTAPTDTYLAIKAQYSTNGGSTWTDAPGGEQSGTGAERYFQISPPKGQVDSPGSVNFSATVSGLTAGASVVPRILGRLVSGTSVTSVTGTATARPN